MRRVQDELRRYAELGVLSVLLYDHTMGRPVLEGAELDAVDTYAERRATDKARARIRAFGEIATPARVVRDMTRMLEEESPGCYEGANTFLELCCGEAAFLVQPYDIETGEGIPLESRGGALDRKIRASRDSGDAEFLFRRLTEVYGYDLQPDNVAVARVNLLRSYEDYYVDIHGSSPPPVRMWIAAEIISRNVFLMDGLTGTVPGTDRRAMMFDWKNREWTEFPSA